MYTKNDLNFFIDGAWSPSSTDTTLDVVDPSTEKPFAKIALGGSADVDRAMKAARAAFETFSFSTKEDRLALLERICAEYEKRAEDLAQAITRELGCPISFSRDEQVAVGVAHLNATIKVLRDMSFDEVRGTSLIAREPIGVCALITPWNWPMNQIVCKVAPALAAGCTVVLKPSEIAPMSGIIFAEIMDAAGTPPGVFNLINGTGPDVGQLMADHPDADMVSFTGSTRAGVAVAKAAADTVKRVAQELGGKSANIIFDDADLESSVTMGVQSCFSNSGQSCDAPTRMFVPHAQHERALEIAKQAAASLKVGDPSDASNDLGPVISQVQFDKIQSYISIGQKEGAVLVTGGPGRPDGMQTGYYVKPTVFGGVTADMTISRDEIFGPVLAILPYETDEEVIALANDSVYGLAAYIQAGDMERAKRMARKLRAGSVYINYPDHDPMAPFGGYKQSGNGREYADWGIHDFLEIKGIVGWCA
jgi:aldehyde dehydrogenase (NAD+)